MSKTHDGYFLIADITGYTQYLSESELEHAQHTLTALLEMLVDNTTPPLVISRLAGDAVISYGLRDSFFQGQSLIEKIEKTYVTFRKTIERLVLNNTCRCNACANIGNLDLKFFIHYGTFGIQHISDHDELVGSDVNLLHRLLKNSVTEQTGIRAYGLYSQSAIQQLGADDLVAGMTAHDESYEHLGEVQVWVQDMGPVWEEKRDAATITFPSDDIWGRFSTDINLPREQVWDYLIQPEFRSTLIGSDRMQIANRTDGRIAPGSVYQCYHGDKMVPQVILEWQPFESMITEELPPMSSAVSSIVEYRLVSIDGGTRLVKTMAKPKGAIMWRVMMHLTMPFFKRSGSQTMDAFARRIEDDFQAHGGGLESEVEITDEQIRQAAGVGLQASSGSQDA